MISLYHYKHRPIMNREQIGCHHDDTIITNHDPTDQLERLFVQALTIAIHYPRKDDSLNAESGDDDDHVDFDLPELSEQSQEYQLALYLAASFQEALDVDFAACQSWIATQDWDVPLTLWLRTCDEDAADLVESSELALSTLTEGLFALFSLPTGASDAKFAVGDQVLALLQQDQEWHQAKVEAVIETDTGDVEYLLRFLEYGNPQTTLESNIRFDSDFLLELATSDLACQICHREILLTFHHLVPRETHSHVLRRSAKALLPEIEPLYLNRPEKYRLKSRKDWLDVHGINICRKCHNQVHRVESNMGLALKMNTLELVLEHPAISKWRSWACKQ